MKINNSKFLNSIKLVSITGVSQVFIQLIGFISGIVLIRNLDTKEYAFYTLANTMLGTMTVLADGGISNGVMAEGGKVWKDKNKLGAVLATGLYLRKKFALFSLLVSSPILIYLLLQNGAPWYYAVLIVCCLVVNFWVTLADSILQVAPRLHQLIVPLQKNQVTVGILRAIMTMGVFLFPWSFFAIIATGIPRWWGNTRLRKIAMSVVSSTSKIEDEYKEGILKSVKKILPTSIYFCLSGQLTIWIVSFLGNTNSIASVGAITRFSVVFTVLNELMAVMIIPRFARLQNHKSSITRFFIMTQVGLYSVVCVIIVSCFFFSGYLLWVLGEKYQNLDKELLLVVISGSVGMLSQVTNRLLASRAIILPSYIFIGYSVFVQFTVAFFTNFSTLKGILLYNLITVLCIYILRVVYFFGSINKVKV